MLLRGIVLVKRRVLLHRRARDLCLLFRRAHRAGQVDVYGREVGLLHAGLPHGGAAVRSNDAKREERGEIARHCKAVLGQ